MILKREIYGASNWGSADGGRDRDEEEGEFHICCCDKILEIVKLVLDTVEGKD